MGGYNTSDLYRRQHAGQTGNAVLADPGRRRRWRAFRVPVGVIALGCFLAFWGPLPGLGVFLMMGGVMGLAMTAGLVLLGGFS